MGTKCRFFLFLTCLCLAAPTVAAQRVGHPAPAIQVDKYLRGPDGRGPSWEELRGKAIVLEFFATWCGPCVKAIPDMNRLVELFADQPIVFVSVTREKAGVVEKFMKKKPMQGWVALDRDGSLMSDYWVRGYPTVALIDSQGVLRGLTHPRRLNADLLGRLMMGHFGDDLGEEALRQREEIAEGVKKSEATESYVAEGDDGTVHMVGLTTMEAVQALYGVDEKRIVPRIEIGDERFDISRPAGGSAIVGPTLQRALEDAARFEAEWQEQERWVYVLRGPDDLKKKLTKSKDDQRQFRGWAGNDLTAATLEELAVFLEERLELPVVDETGVEGTFELSLTWDPAGQMLTEALQEQLGLEVVEQKRRILMLVLEGW